ncbi:MAG TPA: GNAT family N-acetyltransferase [Trebonia sp.]|jgi:predicted GNAT family acetyltransferase|nr:GNAT family N-acetyltransferase [Trebonia sp.]
MRINVTQDLDRFIAAAGPWLVKSPVANNVLLTSIAAQQAGHAKGTAPAVYGWAEDKGSVLGAVRWPPPLPATVTAMPPAAAAALAAALADESAALPGVNGPTEAVSAFAARWLELTGAAAGPRRTLLVSQAREVKLAEWPPGELRRAAPDEAPALAGWITAVLTAAGLPSPEAVARQQVTEQLSGGRLYVWATGGQLAAVIGHAAPAENVVLVHGGYASPEHRDAWYGTAVMAAVTKQLLEQGYACISITDRANPQVGAAMRAVGYEAASELADVKFGPPADR